MKNRIKVLLAAVLLLVTFLGINLSQKKKNVGGETAMVTLVTLGSQSFAYCNEALPGQSNNGLCTGPANDASTRCLRPADVTARPDCIMN